MPPSKTPQGQPLRYVPRRPQAPFPASPHSAESVPQYQLAGAGEPVQLPVLPPPVHAASPNSEIARMLNAIRQLLIDANLAREEE